MTIESSTTIVAKSIVDVFNQMSTASSYEKLMPSEATFRLTDEQHFSFKLGGMPVIPLRMERQIPHSQIVLAADGGSVPFELQIHLVEQAAQTQIQLVFEGDVNPMMQMMIKKPLTLFLEALIANAQKL